jgi:hypothetical protein
LGAPVDLFDLEAAAQAELDAHGPLIAREFGGGPAEFYARRLWRRERPAFLAAKGDLTAVEAALVAQRVRARSRPRPGR